MCCLDIHGALEIVQRRNLFMVSVKEIDCHNTTRMATDCGKELDDMARKLFLTQNLGGPCSYFPASKLTNKDGIIWKHLVVSNYLCHSFYCHTTTKM